MNSFLHLLLFTVVASVLFASSDTTVAAAPAGETDSGVEDQPEPVQDVGDKAKGKGGLLDMLSSKKNDMKKGALLDIVHNARGKAKSLIPDLSGLVGKGIVPNIFD